LPASAAFPPPDFTHELEILPIMNPSFRSLIPALLAVALAPAIPLTAAPARPAPADSAARLLATHGSIPVNAVGPYVTTGTFRIQVAAKLGQPDRRLADRTWIYDQRRVSGSEAEGSLIVRFNPDGRVSSLSLATPAVVTALRAGSENAPMESRLAVR
jgi:hypothetical protein